MEDRVFDRKKIAQQIFDNPFLTGVMMLDRKELFDLLMLLLERLDYSENVSEYFMVEDERDIKDKIFDQKCLLIELLDEDFFKKKTS